MGVPMQGDPPQLNGRFSEGSEAAAVGAAVRGGMQQGVRGGGATKITAAAGARGGGVAERAAPRLRCVTDMTSLVGSPGRLQKVHGE